jgi:hypothetical protein
MDYDNSIHSGGFSLAVIGAMAWQQMWIPILCVSLIVIAAVAIRFGFRRGKKATDA